MCYWQNCGVSSTKTINEELKLPFHYSLCCCGILNKMTEEKRKRSPNWLPSEKNLLIELVEKHFNVIENKKTDGITMKQKLAEWQIISHEYNSQTTHCSRSAENLKNQWEYMKKNAKKEESYNRMHRIQTGGGPANPKKEDPLHSKIISLIKTSAVGLFNPFDSDSVASGSSENNKFAEAKVILPEEPALCSEDLETDINEIPKIGVDSNEVVIQDWSNYTPKLLRTPVSTPLQINDSEQEGKLKKSWTSRRRPTYAASSSSLQKLHEKKIEAINFQKTVAEKETLHLNEVHELDIEIKREQLKQEKLKTRILLLDLRLKKKQLLDGQ